MHAKLLKGLRLNKNLYSKTGVVILGVDVGVKYAHFSSFRCRSICRRGQHTHLLLNLHI